MQNQNANGDALLQALSSGQADELFSDSQLNELIEAEFSKPVEKMDCEVLDACYQLLERRHSLFTKRQIARSERKGLRRFNRFMKQSKDLKANKSVFQFKPLALVALVVIMIISPALILNKGFHVSMPPDEQQYLVVGIQQNDTGVVRASTGRNAENMTIRLKSVDEIPPILGYQIMLPTWMPDSCVLAEISITTNDQFDEVSFVFGNNLKRIFIEVRNHVSRDGVGAGYEQSAKGTFVLLSNGGRIYVTNNEQSVWGLYQSSHIDYFIEAIGFNEETVVKLFDSMGGIYEKE